MNRRTSGIMSGENAITPPTAERAFRPDDELIDPQLLRVREQAGAEVRRHEELVELHVGEIRRAQDHVGVVDDELAIEPAAHDPVGVGFVGLEVERVEFELRLDAVPLVVFEERFDAVVEFAVVAAFERSLGESMRRVLVLDVLCGETQSAIHRLDVEREMTRRRTMPLAVLRGHEVREMRVIVPSAPVPALREFQVVTNEELVGGLKPAPHG